MAAREPRPVRAPLARSRRLRFALRAGDLRGLQGVPAKGREHRDVSPRRERAPLQPIRRPPGDAALARGAFHRSGRRAHPDRSRLGARGQRGKHVPAPARHRDGGSARREARQGIHVPALRLTVGAVLRTGSEARLGVALYRLRARRPRRHRRCQVRRQLRGKPSRPTEGDRRGLPAGRLARRREAPVCRRDGGHEPVLRL